MPHRPARCRPAPLAHLALALVSAAAAAAAPGCSGRDPARTSAAAPIDCERLIPASVRDRHLPEMTVHAELPCAGCAPQCRYRKDGHPGVTVIYDCRRPASDVEAAEARRLLVEQDRRRVEVPDLGRGGLRSPDQVVFWDDEAPCYVSILWPGGKDDALALGRAVEEHLTAVPTAGR